MYRLDRYRNSGEIAFEYCGHEIVLKFNAHSVQNYIKLVEMSKTLQNLQKSVMEIDTDKITGEEAERLGELSDKACREVQSLLADIFGKEQWEKKLGKDFRIEDFDAVGFFLESLISQFARANAERKATELAQDEV